jgi:hypothetical protein
MTKMFGGRSRMDEVPHDRAVIASARLLGPLSQATAAGPSASVTTLLVAFDSLLRAREPATCERLGEAMSLPLHAVFDACLAGLGSAA